MTDKEKLEAIRAEIHRLVDVRGYDREMANDLLTFMDSLPNEPVSDFEMALTEMIDKAQKCVVEPCAIAAQWKDYLIELSKSEEPISEKLEKIVEEIAEPTILNAYGTKELARRLRNTICGTSVSEDLGKASKEWLRPQLDKSYANYGEAKMMELTHFDGYAMLDAIEFGAKWQKENLWKPVDGKDLPDIGREVIVLIKDSVQRNIHAKEYMIYRIGFGHRPNPDGWDGKNIDTNEVTHYTPKLYDKGGWNAPNIAYWLDIELPKEIEL